MTIQRFVTYSASAAAFALCALIGVPSAHADTIAWATWTGDAPGNPGSATGTIGSINVNYAGQTDALLINYPSWAPSSSYTGGDVGNAPPQANNAVKLEGGSGITETITFSSPIVNPVMAIWSLGQSNDPTYFDFSSGQTFNIVAGGPSAEYGGGTITRSGQNVQGVEGNGVIEFDGTFSSITFTTPSFENYYAFTVGEDVNKTSVTPEPGSLALLGTGLVALAGLRRRFTARG